MPSYTHSIIAALVALSSVRVQAIGLGKGAHDPLDLLEPRHLAAREDEQPQRYLASDEKMPEKCDGACEKFSTLTEDCRTKNGTEWQACVCTNENFNAWASCANCAPEYYDLYDGGFAGLFKNGISECEAVGLPVTPTAKLPVNKQSAEDGVTGNSFSTSQDEVSEDAEDAEDGTGSSTDEEGVSSIRMGGSSKTGAASSTFTMNTLAGLFIPISLAGYILF